VEEISGAGAVAVAAVFLSAAAMKLRRIRSFADEVRDYGLLPQRSVPVVAPAVAVAECAAAIALLLPPTHEIGLLALLFLLGTFSGAIAINLRRGRTEIACACFGRSSQTLSWALVLRNGLLMLPLAAHLPADAAALNSVTMAGGAAALPAAALVAVLVEATQLRAMTHPAS
jgi:hypothetical protein